MRRDAFVMQLKPGCVAEYRRRHDEIWPELVRQHVVYGVRNYSIYLCEQTLQLFAYREIADGYCPDDMRSDPLVRKWWDYNFDLMECKPDHEPECIALTEVFHLE